MTLLLLVLCGCSPLIGPPEDYTAEDMLQAWDESWAEYEDCTKEAPYCVLELAVAIQGPTNAREECRGLPQLFFADTAGVLTPKNEDSDFDGDGLADWAEWFFHTDPCWPHTGGTFDGAADHDGDGTLNREEEPALFCRPGAYCL